MSEATKERKELNLPTCYVNRDGTVKKVYARKLWNYVVETSCDSFNGELEDGELEHRVEGFRRMLNELLPHNAKDMPSAGGEPPITQTTD